MAQRKFSRNELDQHLESIGIYWHRHGGEEQAELEDFLEALFAALPSNRVIGAVALTTGAIELNLAELKGRLTDALEGVYDEDEVSLEVDNIADRCIELGGTRSFEDLITDEARFSQAFEEHFNGQLLSDEVYAKTEAIRKAMLSRATPANPDRSELDQRAAEPLEVNLQSLLAGLMDVYGDEREEDEIRASVDELLVDLQGRGGHVNGIRLTGSRDLFQYLFTRYFSSPDEEISEDLQSLSKSLFWKPSADSSGW